MAEIEDIIDITTLGKKGRGKAKAWVPYKPQDASLNGKISFETKEEAMKYMEKFPYYKKDTSGKDETKNLFYYCKLHKNCQHELPLYY